MPSASNGASPILYITALVAGSGFYKPSMSGGDRIALNFAKRWASSIGKVVIFTTLSGKQMFDNLGPNDVTYVLLDKHLTKRRNLWAILAFEARALVKGIVDSTSRKNPAGPSIVYAPSHFWPDVIPAIIMSRRLAGSAMIGTFYLFPPSPFSKTSPYKGKNLLNGLFFYLSQIGIVRLYRRFAKMIWVTNDYDREFMTKLLKSPQIPVLAIKGGIDWPAESISKKWEACFDGIYIGRLHPQKGIQQLIEIWRVAVHQRPLLKLAIVGDGPLENEILHKIEEYGLIKNVTMFGFLDGESKNNVIRKSKVVFYMSTLEIVAMAPIEAMALGLPCVALRIPGRARYFQKGTLLTPPGSSESGAKALFDLIDDRDLYAKLSAEAIELAQEWRWESRGEMLVQEAQKLLVSRQRD